jgi:hypothetical protein
MMPEVTNPVNSSIELVQAASADCARLKSLALLLQSSQQFQNVLKPSF